jgi:3-keto-5-aminohexanoate cleavage enzyme
MEKLIITAAVTGSLPTKKRTPHVPITPAEIVQAGVRCEQAGAAVIHVHARNPADESASTEFKIFEEIYHGLKERTNLIIQISTGGRAGMAYEQRSDRLTLKPEMASLTTGSVNFPDSVYANSPELIEHLAADMKHLGIKPEMEIFDVSMVGNAVALAEKGLAERPLHFDFVMGPGAPPPSKPGAPEEQHPGRSTWTWPASAQQLVMLRMPSCGRARAHRAGDNIYFRKKTSPNERCQRMVQLANGFGEE